jgi:hypothetical protein
MMGLVPQTPWDLSLSLSRTDVFFFTAYGTCRTIEMLHREVGQRRDATRAPIQARNGGRPPGRPLGQVATSSKDCRIFRPNDGVPDFGLSEAECGVKRRQAKAGFHRVG